MHTCCAITSSPGLLCLLPARSTLGEGRGLHWWCLAISIPSCAFLAVTGIKHTSGRKTSCFWKLSRFSSPNPLTHSIFPLDFISQSGCPCSSHYFHSFVALSLCLLVNNTALPNANHSPAFAISSQLTLHPNHLLSL